ncbi:MAG: hypothetical protein JNL74_08205 [Fibrobacteres bacterium]|nr:hypothetical protein [Fibrobacterota bacterium]
MRHILLYTLLLYTIGLTQNSNSWSFGVASGTALAQKSGENELFRTNSSATKFFARYFKGYAGFSFSTGIVTGALDQDALSTFANDSFFTLRKIQEASKSIVSTKPFSAYWVLGPSFKFGSSLQVAADLQAGLFLNNPGSVTIGSLGTVTADGQVVGKGTLYKFEPGGDRFVPGFAGSVSISYPVTQSVHFVVSGDYSSSSSSIKLRSSSITSETPRETEEKRENKFISVSAGLSKSFNSYGVGQPSGKRSSISPRDVASGLPTGKRSHYSGIVSPRDQMSGLPTGKRSAVSGGGGAVGRIVGRVAWGSSSLSPIVNNVSPNGSSNAISAVGAMAGGAGGGAAAASYARGMAMSLFVRSSSSEGLPTGRRQYQPILIGQEGTFVSSSLGSVSNNPMYEENNKGGQNPLYQGKGRIVGKEECDDGNRVAGLTVSLKDPATGRVLSETVTDGCGNFWFDNVPAGNYVACLIGAFLSKKGYDYYKAASDRVDLAGVVETGLEPLQVIVAADTSKLDFKDADSDDDGLLDKIWSPKSNVSLYTRVGDLDGDGAADLVMTSPNGFENGDIPDQNQRASLLGGAIPGGAIISAAVSSLLQPGDPVYQAEVVLLSRGKEIDRVVCDEDGQFEFKDLDKGRYTVVSGGTVFIDYSCPVQVTGGRHEAAMSSIRNMK